MVGMLPAKRAFHKAKQWKRRRKEGLALPKNARSAAQTMRLVCPERKLSRNRHNFRSSFGMATIGTIGKLRQLALAVSGMLFLTGMTLAETAVVVSVADQKLAIVRDGIRVASFPVSTSKFGLGDRPRSYSTPIGVLTVAAKIGAGAPLGAVFKSQRRTGEILPPNAPGRDPIVTRILWLRGVEKQTAQAFSRKIYIHGTTEERKIGSPASYGCIRMKSRDVVRLFDSVPIGARVEVVKTSLSRALREMAAEAKGSAQAS
jgi:lipoprotein-anchoring transpeptidase ErfK/SrfK